MKYAIEAIKSRRSIRSYLPEDVPQESLMQLLDAARWAPSGKNGQPWKFAVIQEDKLLKNQISGLSIYRRWMQSAPCLIIVFLDRNLMYDRQKDLMAIGASIQNLLLAAEELGLGTCWVGEILNREEEMKKLLDVPEHMDITAVITVGYPDGKPLAGKRREVSESLLFQK